MVLWFDVKGTDQYELLLNAWIEAMGGYNMGNSFGDYAKERSWFPFIPWSSRGNILSQTNYYANRAWEDCSIQIWETQEQVVFCGVWWY